MSRRSFTSRCVASEWSDGLVTGTGSLGAVLFGTPHAHEVVFSHEEFFLPLEARVPRAAELAPRMGDIRDLVADGDVVAAADLVEATARASGVASDIVPLDPFVPIAGLRIETDETTLDGSYERWGRFDTGAIGVRWSTLDDRDEQLSETRIDLTPSRDSSTIRVRISSHRAQRVRIEIRLSADRSTNVGNVNAIDFRDRVEADLSVSTEQLTAEVRPTTPPDDERRPIAARIRARVVAGRARVTGSRQVEVQLRGGDDEVVLEVDAEVRRRGRVPELPRSLRATTATHEDLFSACGLDLHSGVDDDEPVETVLTRARAGAASFERAAVELAFAAGRSAVIASTGVLPPNLVGVWQGSWAPAWSGDYTLNGNVQLGAMAALSSTGTPELLRSLFRLLLRFGEQFEDNAQRLFGVTGYAMPAHVSGHAFANHHSTQYPHLFWYGGAAWALRLAFDYFSVTGDVDFVREVGLPFARKTMEFLVAVAIEVDGVCHFIPSFSPENTPAGAANPLSVDATVDLALARDASRIARAFAEAVGEGLDPSWEALAARLPPYRVDPATGALAEWAHPGAEDQVAHRHASQLYPFWYDDGDDATTPAIADAARRTVIDKVAWRSLKPYGPPGHQEMAFGLSSIGIAAARLGDAQSAYQCALWLARDHFEANAVSRHDQGSIFNVDACGALPAVVSEMLVSSSPGRIALLPALPRQWPSGRAFGLTARGGIVIDELRWSGEEVAVTLRRRPGSRAAWTGGVVEITVPDRAAEGGTARLDLDLTEEPRTFRWAC